MVLVVFVCVQSADTCVHDLGGKDDVEALSQGDQRDAGIQDEAVHDESGYLEICPRFLRTALVEGGLGDVLGDCGGADTFFGQIYDCGERELLEQWYRAKNLMRDYNRVDSADLEEKRRILSELLGGQGKNLWITPPFFVDYFALLRSGGRAAEVD